MTSNCSGNCASCGEITHSVVLQHTDCCFTPLCSECYQDWYSTEQKCFNCPDDIGKDDPIVIFMTKLIKSVVTLESNLTDLVAKLDQTQTELTKNLADHYDNVTGISGEIISADIKAATGLNTMLFNPDQLSHQLTTQSQAKIKEIQLQLEANNSRTRTLNNMLSYLTLVVGRLTDDQPLVELLRIANALDRIEERIAGELADTFKMPVKTQPLSLYRHRLNWSIQPISLEARLSTQQDEIMEHRYPGLAKKMADLNTYEYAGGIINTEVKSSLVVRSISPGSSGYWLLFQLRLGGHLGDHRGGQDGYRLLNPGGCGLGRNNTFVTINDNWLVDYSNRGDSAGYFLTSLKEFASIKLDTVGSNPSTKLVKTNLGISGTPDKQHMVLDRDLLYVKSDSGTEWSCYDLTQISDCSSEDVKPKFVNQLVSGPGYHYSKILYVKNNLLVLETNGGPFIVTFDTQTGQEVNHAAVNPGFRPFRTGVIFDDDSMIISATHDPENVVLYRFGPYGVHSSTKIRLGEPYRDLKLLSDGKIAGLVADGDDYLVKVW